MVEPGVGNECAEIPETLNLPSHPITPQEPILPSPSPFANLPPSPQPHL